MRLNGIVVAALVAAFASPALPADVGVLYTALENDDTVAVTSFVEDYYRDAGISTNDALTWEFQSFDSLVNWYNDFTETIRLAELPKPAEAPAYWQNWSNVLTNGAWDWEAFFTSPDEAALMANFNQFLLAAHEFGHALVYRYDPGFNRRWDNEINCREYAADRLAAAFLEEVAGKDERIAALKARYRDLMAAINRLVPPDAHYDDVSYAALADDCRVMHVVQPTAETITPYASAFFVRQGLLQAQDLPTLAEMYEMYLLPYWREIRGVSSGLAGPVSTLERVDVDLDAAETGLEVETRIPAFASDGSLWVLEYGFDGADRLDARFSFGPANGPIEEIFPLQTVPDVKTTGDHIFIGSAVVLSADHVVALQSGIGWPLDEALLFDLRRGADGAWTLRTVDVADPNGYVDLGMAPDADGRIQVFQSPAGEGSPDQFRLTIDPETLEVTAKTEFAGYYGTAVAVGADGTSYFFDDFEFTVVGADGKQLPLAGDRLQGFKDAVDPMAAEFITGRFGVLVGDELRILDRDPRNHDWVLRAITLNK